MSPHPPYFLLKIRSVRKILENLPRFLSVLLKSFFPYKSNSRTIKENVFAVFSIFPAVRWETGEPPTSGVSGTQVIDREKTE